jgi:hypothetical protein
MDKFYSPAPLPQPIFDLLKGDEYDKQGDWSVTGLIGSPRVAQLKSRHEEKVSENVMNRMFAVRGNIMHKALAAVKTKNAVVEERFMIDILGRKVSMKADYVWPYKPGKFQIIDMKDPSRYVVKPAQNGAWYNNTEWLCHTDRDDWEKQLNCYAYGMRIRGFDVDSLMIAAMLRDWSFTEMKRSQASGRNDYPPHEVIMIPIKLWTDSKCLEFLEQRVRLHEQAKLLSDNELPFCTQEERWADPDMFKVVTGAGTPNERAVPHGGEFATKAEAIQFNNQRMAKKPDKASTIVFKPAESKRCERGYCPISEFCNQYKEHIRKDPF